MGGEAPAPGADRPLVSVVVPVRNDRPGLRACLTALAAQTYPGERVEVIVVDDGSAQPVASLASAFPRVRFAARPRGGPYAARNAGIELARGDVLAFTDADCVPAPTWIERGVARLLAEPGCGLVGGRISQSFRRPGRPGAAELWSSLHCFDQRRNVERGRFAATGNLFILRPVIEQAGRFPVVASGGDVLLGCWLHAAGRRLVYADDAEVVHPAIGSVQQAARRAVRFVARRRDFGRLGAAAAPALPPFVAAGLPEALSLLRAAWTDGRLSRWPDRLRVVGVVLVVHGAALWAAARGWAAAAGDGETVRQR